MIPAPYIFYFILVSPFFFSLSKGFLWQCLRLYDVDGLALRLEALSDAALLNCCFQGESVALSVGSDGSVRR